MGGSELRPRRGYCTLVGVPEIAKRAEYLKQQRQRLLDLKKQERTKELEEYEKQQAEKGVPKPGSMSALCDSLCVWIGK